MKVLDRQALLQRPSAPLGGGVPMAVLAQAKSALGSGPGVMSAPAITDAGRPLDGTTRGNMESGFGHDFSNIRIHDDARAHDNARSLSARAYAAGDHIVFGEGQYRPESSSGQALIAHELAHSVQQGGVQMKADGPIPAAADAELEAQADRAAAAVTAGRAAPALSRIGAAAIFRNPVDSELPAAGTPVAAKLVAKTSETDLPDWVTHYKDGQVTDGKPLELTVHKNLFEMPVEKGGGDWVGKIYDAKSDFTSIIFPGQHFSVFKEGSSTAEYRDMWLEKYGFKTTAELVTGIETAKTTNPEVQKIADDGNVKSFLGQFKHATTGLSSSKSAVDHIVEKHMGGTSNPENLQLFDSARNSASGGQSARAVADLARELAQSGKRGENAQRIAIVFKKVTAKPPGAKDPTYHVEQMLRAGMVTGSATVKAAAEGKPIKLVAGNNSGPTRIKDAGVSKIEDSASRVLVGVNLEEYTRTKVAADTIKATLDNGALRKLKLTEAHAALVVSAVKIAEPAAPAAAPDAGAVATSETRQLAIAAGPKNIGFYYPYLSPGTLTSVSLEPDGLHGAGEIRPTVPLLPKQLLIEYGPNSLKLLTKLNKTTLQPPVSGFRFTDGNISLQLAPNFLPSGKISFEIGPAGKPVILGEFNAKYESGAFIATGNLSLAATVPGISGATGELQYHSTNGWSGELAAKSSSIPNSTADVKLGFRTVGGKVETYGSGTLATTIKQGGVLSMTAGFTGNSGMSYSGSGTIPSPLPGVESVDLKGSYRNSEFVFQGTIAASKSPRWGGFDAGMTVNYRKKDGEDGRFSGKVNVAKKGILNGKGDIAGELGYTESGKFIGSGKFSYQMGQHFRPELDFTLFESGRFRVKGTVNVADIELFKAWPDPANRKKTILKGGVSIGIPIPPMPALQATLSVRGELSAFFVVGPGLLGGSLTAELYPFESDPKVKASLNANFRIPAQAGLEGRFGAALGIAIAGGLAGVEGGIDLVPTIGVKGEGGVKSTFEYADGGFSFGADAYATGVMEGTLGIDMLAAVYVFRNLIRYQWTHPLAKWGPKQIGPKLDVTLGKIGYARDGTVTWPSLSQISVTPKEFDPLELVKNILQDSKASPAPEPPELQPRMSAREASPYYMHPGKI